MKKDLVEKQKNKFFGISYRVATFIFLATITIFMWLFVISIGMNFGIVGVAAVIVSIIIILIFADLRWRIRETKSFMRFKGKLSTIKSEKKDLLGFAFIELNIVLMSIFLIVFTTEFVIQIGLIMLVAIFLIYSIAVFIGNDKKIDKVLINVFVAAIMGLMFFMVLDILNAWQMIHEFLIGGK